MERREPPYERFVVRVPASAQGERLDQFLPAALSEKHGLEWSRRATRRAIEAGAVWSEGRRLRVASRRLRPGQTLEVRLLEPRAPKGVVPSLEPERVLFHDDWLLALDKPAGLPSQATPTDALGNALEAARRLLRSEGTATGFLELAHRLDRGTSGVLLLVKQKKTMAPISAAFGAGEVQKRYLVLVQREAATPLQEAWTLDRPLMRDGRRMVVGEGGRSAVTELRTVECWPAAALLEARPLTGRQHQIRVHLAAAGLPVLGDRLYGPRPAETGTPGRGAGRLLLHAHSLRLAHPADGGDLVIEAPVPADFTAALERLRAG